MRVKFYRVDTTRPALAVLFVIRMLTRDLFAVADLLVLIWLSVPVQLAIGSRYTLHAVQSSWRRVKSCVRCIVLTQSFQLSARTTVPDATHADCRQLFADDGRVGPYSLFAAAFFDVCNNCNGDFGGGQKYITRATVSWQQTIRFVMLQGHMHFSQNVTLWALGTWFQKDV